MEKEFLNKLKTECSKNNIDLDVESEEQGDIQLNLTYNGTVFNLQCYEHNNKLDAMFTIITLFIKGREYYYEECNFVDKDYSNVYDTVDNAISEIIDTILNCNVRRTALRIINTFESFIEDMSDEEMDILLSYISRTYNLY